MEMSRAELLQLASDLIPSCFGLVHDQLKVTEVFWTCTVLYRFLLLRTHLVFVTGMHRSDRGIQSKRKSWERG